MKKFYVPIGDSKQGFKLTIPTGVKKAELYSCTVDENGILIYTPITIIS